MFEGCGREHAARGMCNMHLEREKRGTPLDQPAREVFHTDDLHERLRRYAPAGAPDECWEWTRARNKNYGMISIGAGKLRGAHIVAWELANDRKLPEGMVIRHSCDNPPCTNPAHLLLGTHGDNVQDRLEHGQQTKGSANSNSKLTEPEAKQIRELFTSGVSQTQLARQFGVSQSLISLVVRGKIWSHVDGECTQERGRNIKLTEKQVREIRALYESGSWTYKRLATKFGVSYALIAGIVTRKIWAALQ